MLIKTAETLVNDSQSDMLGGGRTLRRKTAKFLDIWPLLPKGDETEDVLFLDGICHGRKTCILICCDDKYVLG